MSRQGSRVSFDTTPAASYAESHLSNVTKKSQKPLSPATLKGCTISFDTGIARNRTKVRDEYEKRRDKLTSSRSHKEIGDRVSEQKSTPPSARHHPAAAASATTAGAERPVVFV